MKIDPGFPNHWKTQMLVSRCGAEAALGLLRLWGNAQISREWRDLALTPRKLASIMGYAGDMNELWAAMTDKDAAWLDEQEDGLWEIHGFAEHQKQVIKLWANGRKGGRPPKEAPPTPPEEDKTLPLARPLTPLANHEVSNRNQMVFKTPTLEEVQQACFTMGVCPKRAEIWFHEHEARGTDDFGRWVDVRGNPVSNWRSALKAWDGKWVANEAARNHRGTVNGHGNPKAASVWELKQSIEQTEKEISRLVGSIANKVYNEDGTSSLRPDVAAKVKQMRAKVAEMRQAMSGVEVAA